MAAPFDSLRTNGVVSVPRTRVVTLNAALGPLDYRVPAGMDGRTGHGRRRPARPAPADRRGVGGRPAQDRGGRRQSPAPARRAGRRSRRSPRPCAASPSGPRIIISARSPRCCGWSCRHRRRSPGRARWSNIAPTGLVPDRLTPQRAQALAALDGRQGTVRELAAHAEVSDAVLRGLINLGAIERIEVDGDAPFPAPDPDFAPPALNDEQAAAAACLIAAIGERLRSGAARRRHRVGQDRNLFRSGRRSAPPGPPDARPAARDRADRTVPDALHRALRRASRSRGIPTCAPRSAGGRGARSPAAMPRSWSARARRCSCLTPTSG